MAETPVMGIDSFVFDEGGEIFDCEEGEDFFWEKKRPSSNPSVTMAVKIISFFILWTPRR